MTADDPEHWQPNVDEEDVRNALEAIDEVAAEHEAGHAAGMRHARVIAEERLLGNKS